MINKIAPNTISIISMLFSSKNFFVFWWDFEEDSSAFMIFTPFSMELAILFIWGRSISGFWATIFNFLVANVNRADLISGNSFNFFSILAPQLAQSRFSIR